MNGDSIEDRIACGPRCKAGLISRTPWIETYFQLSDEEPGGTLIKGTSNQQPVSQGGLEPSTL